MIVNKIGTSIIKPSNKSKNLGVIFDKHLNFNAHIGNVCKAAYSHVKNIEKACNMISEEAAAQAVHSLISSRIDYCNSSKSHSTHPVHHNRCFLTK